MAVRQVVGASPSGVDGSGAMAARRRLGRLLTELREVRGITQEAAAEFIERVPSTLYKLESGRPGVRIRIKHDIHGLCDLYQVDDAVREGLVQLAEATKVRGWFLPNQDAVPPNVEVYLGLEPDAAQLDTFESSLIPGLFQTEHYARQLMTIPARRAVCGSPRRRRSTDSSAPSPTFPRRRQPRRGRGTSSTAQRRSSRIMHDRSQATWRISSRSDNLGNCVEVGAAWRKAARSQGSGNCVDVAADVPPRQVAIRDSKDQEGPMLAVTASEWRAFLAALRTTALR